MEWWSNGVMHLPPPTFDFGTRWGACPERKSKDRFFARLASEIFLSSLRKEFFSNPLDRKRLDTRLEFAILTRESQF